MYFCSTQPLVNSKDKTSVTYNSVYYTLCSLPIEISQVSNPDKEHSNGRCS